MQSTAAFTFKAIAKASKLDIAGFENGLTSDRYFDDFELDITS